MQEHRFLLKKSATCGANYRPKTMAAQFFFVLIHTVRSQFISPGFKIFTDPLVVFKCDRTRHKGKLMSLLCVFGVFRASRGVKHNRQLTVDQRVETK